MPVEGVLPLPSETSSTYNNAHWGTKKSHAALSNNSTEKKILIFIAKKCL